jgi:uncharacterized SAM-binding protein YcdF (DUF218 family)
MIAGADVVRYLLSAGGVVCVMLAASCWAVYASRSRRSAHALLAISVAFAIISNLSVQLLISRGIVGPLRPFAAGDAADGPRTAIVILGSGSYGVEDWSGRRLAVADPASAARALEAARVFAVTNPAVVISSGGNPRPERWMTPPAETMRDLLVRLGVPQDRIALEIESATTREEAIVIARMLRSLQIEQTILVTSSTHMRRSLGAFRAVGISAVPAIAQELPPAQTPPADYVLPSERGLYFASSNAHELIGILYYRLRGWIR